MKKPHVLAIACLFLVSGFTGVTQAQDDDGLKTQLVGKWVPDVEKTIEHMKEDNDEVGDDVLEMMTQMLPDVVLKFNDDDTFKMNGPQGEQVGDFEIGKVDAEKKSLAITVMMEQGERNADIIFSDKDAMKLVTQEGETIFFKRAKKEVDSDDSATDESDG